MKDEIKKQNHYEQFSKDMFLCGLELLKDYPPGTPEFELGFQQIITYKVYVDRKAARITPINYTEESH